MKKFNILVVEDEALIAASLVHTLLSLGYTVQDPVATGNDAIHAVKTNRPDLILMDIQLLGAMTGIETAEKIRAIADIPVVYLTAYTDDLRLKQAQLTEPYGYIVKPAHSRELNATIEMALYKHSLDRKIKESERHYRELADSITDIFFAMDYDLRYTHWNKSSENLTGIKSCDAIGRSINELFPDTPEIRKATEIYRDVLKNRQPQTFENQFITGDRSIFFEIRVYPSFEGISVFSKDITKRKLAEEALHASEERLELALNISQMGTWDLNLVNHSAWRSLRHDQIFGYESLLPEWTYEMFIEHVLPDDRAEVNRKFEEANSDQHDWEFECRIRRTDGEVRWILAKGRIQYGNQGEPQRMLGLVQDITERKRIEETLQESEERFLNAFEYAAIGVALVSPDGRWLRVNQSTCEIVGYSENELKTMTFQDITHPDDLYTDLEYVHRMIAGEIKTYQMEKRYFHKSGELVWVLLSVSLVRDNQRKPLYFISQIENITGRKRAEEALHESARYTRNLIEVSLDPLVTISPEGKITDVNASTELVTGFTRDQLIGTDFSDYFTDTDKAKKGYMKVFDSGIVRDYPLEIKHRDGKIIPVMYNATIYRDESGAVQGIFAAARDITERKVAEEALHQANKKLNLLSSITRHDINNQLTVLMGYLAIINKKLPDPTLNEYFQKVATAAQRISSMIKFTKEYDSIGVNAAVWQDCRTVVDTAAKEAPLGQVVLKNDLPAGSEVFADPLIVKVCYNLMDNAARYGGKITTIRFFIDKREGDPIVVCEDDGDGVVAEEKEKIFVRGFGKNTGLGLALAREILDITGITIRETGEPGKGARFEMTVPKGAWRFKPL